MILQPATVCCGLAVTAALAMILLLWVIWFRYQALERHLLQRQETAEKAAEALRQAVAQLARDFDDLAQHAGSSPSLEPRRGLNLSRRSQALRMHRRGESAEQIASALGVSRQEIQLLLKVHQILVAML
jgi:hypothetical protein